MIGLRVRTKDKELYLAEQVGFLLVGRSIKNDLVINNESISRQHLRFECRDNR